MQPPPPHARPAHDSSSAPQLLLPTAATASKPPSPAAARQGIFASLIVINVFPRERMLILRERAAGTYYVSAYYLAKSCAEMLISVIYPIVFSITVRTTVEGVNHPSLTPPTRGAQLPDHHLHWRTYNTPAARSSLRLAFPLRSDPTATNMMP